MFAGVRRPFLAPSRIRLPHAQAVIPSLKIDLQDYNCIRQTISSHPSTTTHYLSIQSSIANVNTNRTRDIPTGNMAVGLGVQLNRSP